jgi:hypothetical protein
MPPRITAHGVLREHLPDGRVAVWVQGVLLTGWPVAPIPTVTERHAALIAKNPSDFL